MENGSVTPGTPGAGDGSGVRALAFIRQALPTHLPGSPLIVCHCHVVSDRAVAAAVTAGARTLAGVCRSTGAGKDCGACVFSLKRVLCEHQAEVPSQVTAIPEVDVAAS